MAKVLRTKAGRSDGRSLRATGRVHQFNIRMSEDFKPRMLNMVHAKSVREGRVVTLAEIAEDALALLEEEYR